MAGFFDTLFGGGAEKEAADKNKAALAAYKPEALSYLQQNPGKLVELAHLLGHESLDTTAIYTQPAVEDLVRDLEHGRLNVYG